MLIIVEKVDSYILPSHKIIQGAIGVQAAENIEITDTFYRDIFWRAFMSVLIYRREFKGVVLAAKTPWVK